MWCLPIVLILPLLATPIFAGEPTFPGTTWQAAPEHSSLVWSAERLRVVEERLEATKPTAVMIVHDGRVILSWGDAAQTVNVLSVTRSLVSALYGIGIAEGRIDLNRTLATLGIHDNEPGLTVAERDATIRDLLMSRSGIYHGAIVEGWRRVAARPPRGSHAPGEVWFYNDWGFNALSTIYTRLTRESIFEAFDKRIARAIGMQDFQLERDGHFFYDSVSSHPAYAVILSARDLARFGLLYMNDGMWAGKQLIPSGWVKESTRRWSDAENGLGYGYMWWELPAALGLGGSGFAAWGSKGQAVAVIPSKRLVVVQTANRTDSLVELSLSDFIELLRLIVDAGPGS